jgi:hypothetical protein
MNISINFSTKLGNDVIVCYIDYVLIHLIILMPIYTFLIRIAEQGNDSNSL